MGAFIPQLEIIKVVIAKKKIGELSFAYYE